MGGKFATHFSLFPLAKKTHNDPSSLWHPTAIEPSADRGVNAAGAKYVSSLTSVVEDENEVHTPDQNVLKVAPDGSNNYLLPNKPLYFGPSKYILDTGAAIDAMGRQNLDPEDQKREGHSRIQYTFDTAGGTADASTEVHFDLPSAREPTC